VGYLEQFARNRRNKEKTEVLTARLPKSLYSEFKYYCDDLGLSISEAVCLLVELEMSTENSGFNEIATTEEYIKNDDETKVNTEMNTNVVDEGVKVVEKNTRQNQTYTNRFTTKQFQVNGELPCPICGEWKKASNFARHAKGHKIATEEIFTKEEYQDKINAMIDKQRLKG